MVLPFIAVALLKVFGSDMERTMAESQEITSAKQSKKFPLFKRFARAFLKIFVWIM